MLILARRTNESIMIGDDIEISVLEVKGDQVKLGVAAPRTVKVYRQEVYLAIQEENKAAAASLADLDNLSRMLRQKKSGSSED